MRDFPCCGGSDEDPTQHTQDCSEHPPPCVVCRKRRSTQTIALGDAYARVCDTCARKRSI